jgi:hypothetical protein
MIAPRDPRAWRARINRLQLERQTDEQRTAHVQAFIAARGRILGRLRMMARAIPIAGATSRPRLLGFARELDVDRLAYQGAGVHTVERVLDEIRLPIGWIWYRAELRHSIIVGPAWLLVPWRRLQVARCYLATARYLQALRSSDRQ